MGLDIASLSKDLGAFSAEYLRAFLGFLLSPREAVRSRLDDPDRLARIEKYGRFGGLDEKAVVFAGLSLFLGAVLGSTLHIEGAPEDLATGGITRIVLTFLILWVLYGVILHGVMRLHRAKGSLTDTINVVLYSLGVLHIAMILVVYAVSLFAPGALSYDITLRDLGGYGDLVGQSAYSIFGVNAKLLYYGVSSLVTAIYLAIGLSEAHAMRTLRVWGVYFTTFVLTAFVLVVGAFGVVLLATALR